MTDIQKYEFDRLGYLVIPGLLGQGEAQSLAAAIDALEEHALTRVNQPPRKKSPWDWAPEYHANPDKGYHVAGECKEGATLIIEDFFNADPVFDLLVEHPPTMALIRAIVQDRPTINNSEIRIRYPGNQTPAHMGGPIGPKYRYGFNRTGIDCMMVRMVYFMRDVGPEDGPFCVVPATHKSNYPTPYGTSDSDAEPGMVGLPVKAGDAILFTEHLRHGGKSIRSGKTRKTLHIGYGPYWMKSQNIATMDEDQHILPATLARLTKEQRALFRSW
jgi:ectoine hydroxylase-related dioxygenase (phytanoyl-CoA dioxygenase family)